VKGVAADRRRFGMRSGRRRFPRPLEASKPLRYAGKNLNRRRSAGKAEVGSDVQLQIGTNQPGERNIKTVLSGPQRRIIVVVRPEFDVQRHILDDLLADIYEIDKIRMASVVCAVLERVDFGIER